MEQQRKTIIELTTQEVLSIGLLLRHRIAELENYKTDNDLIKQDINYNIELLYSIAGKLRKASGLKE